MEPLFRDRILEDFGLTEAQAAWVAVVTVPLLLLAVLGAAEAAFWLQLGGVALTFHGMNGRRVREGGGMSLRSIAREAVFPSDPVRVVGKDGGGGINLESSGRARAELPRSASETIEERVDRLVVRLNRFEKEIRQEFSTAVQGIRTDLREGLRAERGQRIAGDQDITERVRSLATRGLAVEATGLAWVLAGLLLRWIADQGGLP